MGNNKVIDELNTELSTLYKKHLEEVLDFVHFIKVKILREPSQSYFWTKEWQKLEKEADEDREKGRVVGNGSVESLMEIMRTF
ncbi:hypothetical protein JXI42_05300 [bacterium]|nr:hypothetical protein [bacterium]